FESGETTVHITEAPFSLRVERAGRTVSESAAGERDCAPLAVALRPPDDDGSRYHRPDGPSDALEWLRSASAELVGDGVALVDLVDDDGERQGRAELHLSATDHGFVDVDVTLPFSDRAIALATLCFALAENEHVVGGGER